MKNLTVTSILAATASTLVASAAQAAVFTFNAADDGLSTITQTVDGITLTVSNPSPSPTFRADGFGLSVFGFGSFAIIDSFNLSFSAPVQLIGYRVGFAGLNGNESITLTAGSSSSVENSPFAVGSRNFNNQFTVAANQTISVIGAGVDIGDLIQWSSIEVAPASPPPATPEPGSLVALGVIGLGFLGVKKKNNR